LSFRTYSHTERKVDQSMLRRYTEGLGAELHSLLTSGLEGGDI